MSKYSNWKAIFQLSSERYLDFSIDELEDKLGEPLPPSARRYAAWWYGHPHNVWERLGWAASLSGDRVLFRRLRPAARLGAGDPSWWTSERRQEMREKQLARYGRTVPAAASSRMPGDLILVGCVGGKRDRPMSARNLFDSPLFERRRHYAEATGKPWFVLSAKYGLVDPDRVIEPYDVSLKAAPVSVRTSWASQMAPAVIEAAHEAGARSLELHAGAAYVDFGLRTLLEEAGFETSVPTRGLRIGEQLAWYQRPNPQTNQSASVAEVPPSPISWDERQAIADRLLEVAQPGSGFPGQIKGQLTSDREANEFVLTNPFAYLLAVIFDQGILFERAWAAPLELKRRLGHLDPATMVAEPDRVREAIQRRPSLHRYVNNMPRWVVAAANRVLEEYGEDAARIWNDEPTATQLQQRFDRFLGIGQKKAAMAVELLAQHLDVPIRAMEGSDIAFDIHLRRVFLRTGIADRDESTHMIDVARRLHPERPGELDEPSWRIGRLWCHPTGPDCPGCPMAKLCPKLIDRAITVA